MSEFMDDQQPTNVVPFTRAQMDAMGVCRSCGGMNGFHDGIRTGSRIHPLAALAVDDYPPGEEGYLYGCGDCAHGERCHCGPNDNGEQA